MKTLYIHSTIDSTVDSTGSVISSGSYWDCSGREPKAIPWEFTGDEKGLMLVLAEIRDSRDAEFMHVVNRSI